ncbi:hypothetical protein [Rufibacter roseus]|uniref:Tail fiber protein n=1 Tax=Rufibacter roseus TaxID=1567108 RepID=A0ABW2DP22_9BACT|nr:hypothetical protein [Rufibacter roseus]
MTAEEIQALKDSIAAKLVSGLGGGTDVAKIREAVLLAVDGIAPKLAGTGKFKGIWAAGAMLADTFWVYGNIIWRTKQDFNSAVAPTANNAYWEKVLEDTSNGGGTWGTISGLIEDQTDLTEYVKAEISTAIQGIEIPEPPEGYEWVSTIGVVIEESDNGGEVQLSAGVIKKPDGAETTIQPSNHQYSNTSLGMKRRDLYFLASANLAINVILGDPANSNSAMETPVLPPGGIFVTYVDISDGSIPPSTPAPADLSGYVKFADLTQTLGTASDKAPSEKAVSDAVSVTNTAVGNINGGYPLKFDKKQIISATVIGASTFTIDTTGLKPGTPILLVLDMTSGAGVAIGAGATKKAGDFLQHGINYVELFAVSATNIFYEIYQ